MESRWHGSRRGAARRRAGVKLEQRGFAVELAGAQGLIAACAKSDAVRVQTIVAREPELVRELVALWRRTVGGLCREPGMIDGNASAAGAWCGNVAAPNPIGDGYFDVAKGGTALHNAGVAGETWRCSPAVLERGTPVNALDRKGRSALMLAVKGSAWIRIGRIGVLLSRWR